MQNITLCGFMGSGKTTVGRLLASELRYSFVDMDAEIEEEYGMTISEIFRKYGENAFRNAESSIAETLCRSSRQVISTGGGAVLRESNAAIFKRSGPVVFLDVGEDTVIRRLGRDTSRPLLAGDNREEKIRVLLSERRPLYLRAATIVVDGSGTPKAVAKKILDSLKI